MKKRSSVLILEDDADIALVAEDALRRAGIGVRVTPTVDGAERACDEARPDLALVDIQLPGRSGWEFLAEASRWPGMRVALFTVHEDDVGYAERAHALGVDARVSKYAAPDELVSSVKRMLKASAART
jgi:DNA-binding response OmpR family regulator